MSEAWKWCLIVIKMKWATFPSACGEWFWMNCSGDNWYRFNCSYQLPTYWCKHMKKVHTQACAGCCNWKQMGNVSMEETVTEYGFVCADNDLWIYGVAKVGANHRLVMQIGTLETDSDCNGMSMSYRWKWLLSFGGALFSSLFRWQHREINTRRQPSKMSSKTSNTNVVQTVKLCGLVFISWPRKLCMVWEANMLRNETSTKIPHKKN